MTPLELANRCVPANLPDRDAVVMCVAEAIVWAKRDVLCQAAAEIDIRHYGGRMMYVTEAAQHCRQMANEVKIS